MYLAQRRLFWLSASRRLNQCNHGHIGGLGPGLPSFDQKGQLSGPVYHTGFHIYIPRSHFWKNHNFDFLEATAWILRIWKEVSQDDLLSSACDLSKLRRLLASTLWLQQQLNGIIMEIPRTWQSDANEPELKIIHCFCFFFVWSSISHSCSFYIPFNFKETALLGVFLQIRNQSPAHPALLAPKQRHLFQASCVETQEKPSPEGHPDVCRFLFFLHFPPWVSRLLITFQMPRVEDGEKNCFSMVKQC